MPKRTGEKYEAILDAAIKVFAEHGYYRSQVSKIAKEAGVADGTVYLYFENKQDILISLFRSLMGEFVAALKAELAEETGFEAKLRRLVEFHMRRLGRNRQRAVVTQIELRQPDPVIRMGISEPLREYFRVIENLIEEGKREGAVRPEVDVRLARKMVFGSMDEVVTCWVMSRREYDLQELAGPVYEFIARGLLINAAKGAT